MILRIASAAFALLFAFGAVVQWNDPDPVRWMTAYLSVAVLSAAAAAGRMWPWPTLAVGVGLLVWLAIWSPALEHTSLSALQSLGMSGAVEEEEVREAWGLALLLLWTAVLGVTAFRRSPPSRRTT